MTDTLIHEDTTIRTDDGSHDAFAHYVLKAEQMRAAVTGEPCIALCGKVWVPNRNPDGLTVCPECKDVYEFLKASEGK
jgi:hypothetical protein